MKVLFLTRRFYPDIGGVETHILNISQELIKAGHQITIISEESLKKAVTQKDSNLPESINIIRLNFGKEDKFKKFRIWRTLLKLRSVILDADIVHCHDVFFWYLPFRFLFPNKKVYTTFHGYETVFPPSKKAVRIRKLSEKLSTGNICVGEYISKWYGTKPTYTTYGGTRILNSSKRSAQDRQFQISNQSSNKTLKILLIGRLEKDIGINTYLKSLEMLKTKKIRYEFESLGEGSLKKYVEKYGKARGSSNNLEKFLNKTDVVFASSYLTMLEAMVNKKIVIAVFENPLKEDYLKLSPFSEFIYICKNEKEVVDVLKSVIADKWKSNSMLERGYTWAKKQTWGAVTHTYLQLWQK